MCVCLYSHIARYVHEQFAITFMRMIRNGSEDVTLSDMVPFVDLKRLLIILVYFSIFTIGELVEKQNKNALFLFVQSMVFACLQYQK